MEIPSNETRGFTYYLKLETMQNNKDMQMWSEKSPMAPRCLRSVCSIPCVKARFSASVIHTNILSKTIFFFNCIKAIIIHVDLCMDECIMMIDQMRELHLK